MPPILSLGTTEKESDPSPQNALTIHFQPCPVFKLSRYAPPKWGLSPAVVLAGPWNLSSLFESRSRYPCWPCTRPTIPLVCINIVLFRNKACFHPKKKSASSGMMSGKVIEFSHCQLYYLHGCIYSLLFNVLGLHRFLLLPLCLYAHSRCSYRTIHSQGG